MSRAQRSEAPSLRSRESEDKNKVEISDGGKDDEDCDDMAFGDTEGGGGRGNTGPTGPSVSVKFWSPDTPYLRALKEADVKKKYEVYLQQREENIDTPAFYMDCAHFFIQNEMKDLAIRCVTNVVEMKLDSHELLRMLGYLLDQFDAYELAVLVFEKVLKLRPFEPQSFRDLALVLEQKGDYQRAIDLLWDVVIGTWNNAFDQIELTALYELNAIVARCEGFKDQGEKKSKTCRNCDSEEM